jgi:hypothetical protein
MTQMQHLGNELDAVHLGAEPADIRGAMQVQTRCRGCRGSASADALATHVQEQCFVGHGSVFVVIW